MQSASEIVYVSYVLRTAANVSVMLRIWCSISCKKTKNIYVYFKH
jgi:hypothetical protein